MTIRYDKAYNYEIRRVVRNFNQKRNRAIKRGFKNIPEPMKVSDLKARYTSRQALNKQLTQLKRFTKGKDTLKEIETKGGAKAIKWELSYLKSNLQAAKEHFNKEYKLIESKVGDFPGERMRLDAISKKLATLDLDVAYMTQSQFNSYRAAINEFISRPKKLAAGYRGFLTEVDNVMSMVGIEERRKKKFFEKINTLNPEQFFYLFEKSDLVSRVFELADSPIYGDIKLNTTEEIAEDLIETLLEETDDLVKKAKAEG